MELHKEGQLILKGTIKEIGALQEFESGFKKREFVLTTEETYPQDVKFEVVKDKAESFDQFNSVGKSVSVKFNVRGNEYQGKHYVSLQAWYIESNGTAEPSEVVEANDGMPF